MAYPVVAAPYGFKPINLIGGQVFAGSTRMFPIAYNYATAINFGDLVDISGGSIITTTLAYNITSTAAAGRLGVFLGCSYTSPQTGQKMFSNSYPANTLANDIMAYVEDDPDAIFKTVMVAYSTSAYASLLPVSQAYVNTNVCVNSASTPINNNLVPANATSAMAVQPQASTNARAVGASPFRVVGLVPETAVVVPITGTTSSTTLTLTAANSSLNVGMQVYGPGIFQGSYNYITAISGTAVTLANAVSTAQSTTASFTAVGYPEVLVKWNFGYHSYYNAAGL